MIKTFPLWFRCKNLCVTENFITSRTVQNSNTYVNDDINSIIEDAIVPAIASILEMCVAKPIAMLLIVVDIPFNIKNTLVIIN